MYCKQIRKRKKKCWKRSDWFYHHLSTIKKHKMEQTRTALLIMDMQSSVLGMLPDTTGFISNAAEAIATARKQNMVVI